jgi:Bacterial pre-peptidase C-terminal domain
MTIKRTAPYGAAGVLSLLMTAISTHAGVVFEIESNGQAVNNGLSGAQFLAANAFTPNDNPNVFGSASTATIIGAGGGNDVDFFAFNASAGMSYFDIDGAGYDTYLALFDANGTLLADNDDSFPGDAGSGSQFDAFLGAYTLSSAGLYYIAVSRSGNFANATFTGSDFFQLSRPDGAFGGFGFIGATFGDSSFVNAGTQAGLEYTLHVSVVPGPGVTAVLASALGGAFARRRRRLDR